MRTAVSNNPPPQLIALEGSRNFRDLGGYPAGDGRRVRPGRVFRSGTLAYLSPAGQRDLAALGIRTVCDLRTTRERRTEPSVALPPAIHVLSWEYELDHGAVMGAVMVAAPQAEQVRAAITVFYQTAAEDFAARLAQIFQLLLAGQAPLVLHCAAGKDRTGVAAALLLTALGVAPAAVVADYALSDQVTDFERLVSDGESWRFLRELAPEVRAPLFASEPAYIEAMLQSVRERYGSVGQYLHSRLGLDAAAITQLRNLYLTD
jgi:protein-tyrosine phosphatase